MADAGKIREVLESYLAGINTGGGEAVAGLFAVGGTVEDPVGSEVVEAKDFFAVPFSGVSVELVSPISTSLDGSAGAMAFTLYVPIEGERMKVNVIDVMQFDADGKITQMRAHWGPSDVIPA